MHLDGDNFLPYLTGKEKKSPRREFYYFSGGGIAFMRPITKQAYGVPPEQVVVSSVVSEFQVKDGKPDLVRMPKIDFINDKATKPVGVYEHIGRRPQLFES